MSIIAVPAEHGHTLIGPYGELRARLLAEVAAGRLTPDGLLAQGVMPDGRCYVHVRLLDAPGRPLARRWPLLAAGGVVLAASGTATVLAVAWVAAHWAMLLGAAVVAAVVVAVLGRIRG